MRSERTTALIVVALGLTQIIGYGTLYYSFSVLAPAMAADFGWPVEWIFGALSVALLVGGLVAPWAGRAIDSHGAGRVMAIGSVMAALALVAAALSPAGLIFAVALIAIEIASTLVQYNAAFALLVQRQPRTAARTITYLTLIAGFASTIFWPVTAALHAHLSWQQVYLVFALLHLALCLPVHAWFASTLRRPNVGTLTDAPVPVIGSMPAGRRRPAFTLLVAGFALQSFVIAAILIHMLPLMTALGLGAAGVLIGSLFGPAQVLSRFTNMMFGGGLSQVTLAIIAAVLLPLAIVILLASGSALAGALVFAVVLGLGSGLNSIVQGTLPLTLFGSDGYGGLQGRVTAVRLIVTSAAPFVLALLMETMGVGSALMITAILGAAAVLMFLGIAWLGRPDAPHEQTVDEALASGVQG